jgi:phosphate transport system protein
MQRHLDVELDKLRNRIIKMCSLVDDQVRLTFKALLSGNEELANQVLEVEDKIDHLDTKIDKFCHELVALGQPVAKDLRFIMATIKIDNDLERIGDIAAGIATKIESVKEILNVVKILKVDEFAAFSENMIKDAIDSFVNSDVTLAKNILRNVNESDKKHQEIFKNLVVEMTNNKEIVPAAADLVLVLRHISRLSDHATNIAEEVIFLLEGKIVKHQKNLEILN